MASVRLGKELRSKISKAAKLAYDATTTEVTLDNETLEEIWKGVVDHPTHKALNKFVADHKGYINSFLHMDFRPQK